MRNLICLIVVAARCFCPAFLVLLLHSMYIWLWLLPGYVRRSEPQSERWSLVAAQTANSMRQAAWYPSARIAYQPNY